MARSQQGPRNPLEAVIAARNAQRAQAQVNFDEAIAAASRAVEVHMQQLPFNIYTTIATNHT